MGKLKDDLQWHGADTGEVLATTHTDPDQGLTEQQVRERQAEFGENSLPQAPPVPAWRRFMRQFHNLLIYVLLGAAVLAGALGEWLDAGVILTVVLVNATIGFIQEGKAERALAAIQGMLASNTKVLRQGQKQEVQTADLVPGDIVLLEAGDKVPADLRLLKTKNIQCQESMLTGESVPVDKSPAAVQADLQLADRSNMAYSGTLVTQGTARGLVVSTGADTELGRINRMLSNVEILQTPLLKNMAQFARYLTMVVILGALAVFALGILRGNDPIYLFMAVVSLVVAAIPEGLPTILTVALAIGVTKMARRKSIIRRLPAVETLGAVSVICSDKTGTLTRNEMMVATVATPAGQYEVTGEGYQPEGTFRCQGAEVDPVAEQHLQRLVKAGAWCNEARLQQQGGQWEVLGDPMEGALLALARKAGEDQQPTPIDTLPFDSRYKYMATLHELEGQRYVLVKGAPEKILELAAGVWQEDSTEPATLAQHDWQQQLDEIAANGQRVLALAIKPVSANTTTVDHHDLTQGLQLLGLTGLIDPPRQEAIQAIKESQQAGIRVKMITGDHSATAQAIGRELGLVNTDRAMTGAELEQLSDTELSECINDVDIFARTTPEHKLRLVKALQAQDAVVAMTGDGVNDAPALKRADIGIAMGKGGTEAAREASEMVLTDDNFATIVDAVKEGRTVYDNLKKAISFLLPVNGGESLAIIIALLFALTLPIQPLQILWVNMVSSVALALALAFEASERDVMRRPPRDAKQPLLSPFLVWRVILVSLLFTAGIFGVFRWALAQGMEVEYARTLAVNTLVAMEVWYLFSVRYLRRGSFFAGGIRGTAPILIAVSLVFVLQLVFTYAPFMQFLFETQGLQWTHGLLTVVIGVGLFVALELEKAIRLRFFPHVNG